MNSPVLQRLKSLPRWASIGALAALVLLLAGLYLLRPKTVALLVNGETRLVTTRAMTVGGALRAGGLDALRVVSLEPARRALLGSQQIVQISYQSDVHIVDGENEWSLHSAERSPAGWLAEAGVALSPADQLYVQGQPVAATALLLPANYYELIIRRAQEATLTENDRPLDLHSAAATLGEALYQAGAPLRVADAVSRDLGDPLASADGAVVRRSRALSIHLGDQTLRGFSASATVGQALADAGVALQALDVSLPASDQPLPEDGVIRVVRVREAIELTQNLLPFETQFQALPEVPIDTQQVVQAGAYGVEAQRVRVRYEDGAEVDRAVEASWVAQQPMPRIEGYGTKIEVRTLDTADGTIEYWRALEFYATSYSPARSGTSPEVSWYGHVYCGGLLQNGFVGVDLDYVPCGTPLYIPGYGYAVAMDTGNINGAWIDLGYTDEDFQVWHQFVTVYFLTPVPPLENIAWTIPPGSFY